MERTIFLHVLLPQYDPAVVIQWLGAAKRGLLPFDPIPCRFRCDFCCNYPLEIRANQLQ
jgi:hypothetical protein